MASRLGRIDHTFLVLNLLLLMVVSLLPFPTRMVAEELASGSDADQQTAALLYAGTFLLASIAFYLLWWLDRPLPDRGVDGAPLPRDVARHAHV